MRTVWLHEPEKPAGAALFDAQITRLADLPALVRATPAPAGLPSEALAKEGSRA